MKKMLMMAAGLVAMMSVDAQSIKIDVEKALTDPKLEEKRARADAYLMKPKIVPDSPQQKPAGLLRSKPKKTKKL